MAELKRYKIAHDMSEKAKDAMSHVIKSAQKALDAFLDKKEAKLAIQHCRHLMEEAAKIEKQIKATHAKVLRASKLYHDHSPASKKAVEGLHDLEKSSNHLMSAVIKAYNLAALHLQPKEPSKERVSSLKKEIHAELKAALACFKTGCSLLKQASKLAVNHLAKEAKKLPSKASIFFGFSKKKHTVHHETTKFKSSHSPKA